MRWRKRFTYFAADLCSEASLYILTLRNYKAWFGIPMKTFRKPGMVDLPQFVTALAAGCEVIFTIRTHVFLFFCPSILCLFLWWLEKNNMANDKPPWFTNQPRQLNLFPRVSSNEYWAETLCNISAQLTRAKKKASFVCQRPLYVKQLVFVSSNNSVFL